MVAHIKMVALLSVDAVAVSLASAEVHVSYQALFQLVVAMNQCRCGYAEDPQLACHRLPICRQEYIGRLSGPLLDRFDVRVNVLPAPLSEMMGSEKGEANAIIAARVSAASEMHMARQNCLIAHLDGEALYKWGRRSLLARACSTALPIRKN